MLKEMFWLIVAMFAMIVAIFGPIALGVLIGRFVTVHGKWAERFDSWTFPASQKRTVSLEG